MLFQQRSDVLVPWRTGTHGTTVTHELPREFFLEGILINIRIIASGAITSAVYTGDWYAGLLDRVRLTVATGSNTRVVVNSNSQGLIQLHRLWNGGLDRYTVYTGDRRSGSPIPMAAGTRHMTVPIFFAPPCLDDPVASAFLLPLPRYSSNPVLELQFAPSADFGASGLPPFEYEVVLLRRFVDVPNWVTFDAELSDYTVTYASAGDNQPWELPAPGAYTAIIAGLYQSNGKTVRDWFAFTDTTSGSTKSWEVKFLGTSLRRQSPLTMVVLQDFASEVFAGATADSGCFGQHWLAWDFLTDKVGSTAADFGSVLDTTPLIAQGARVNLNVSVANAGDKIRWLTHRVFGDISALKLGRK